MTWYPDHMSWSIAWAFADMEAWSFLLGVVRYDRAFTVYLLYFSFRVSW